MAIAMTKRSDPFRYKALFFQKCRTAIKRWGLGISSGYYERGPRLLSKENRRNIESKETPCCLIDLAYWLYLPGNLKT